MWCRASALAGGLILKTTGSAPRRTNARSVTSLQFRDCNVGRKVKRLTQTKALNPYAARTFIKSPPPLRSITVANCLLEASSRVTPLAGCRLVRGNDEAHALMKSS